MVIYVTNLSGPLKSFVRLTFVFLYKNIETYILMRGSIASLRSLVEKCKHPKR